MYTKYNLSIMLSTIQPYGLYLGSLVWAILAFIRVMHLRSTPTAREIMRYVFASITKWIKYLLEEINILKSLVIMTII
jgi:hypothetical protein